MNVPVLFLQGTRDNFCPLADLAKVRPKMKAETELHVVETGNHSLEVTKTFTKQCVSPFALDALDVQ